VRTSCAGLAEIGSLANWDRDDFFDPLTAALKKWHQELMENGVI